MCTYLENNYKAELDALASCVGGRNQRLLTIAIKGRRAGVSSEDMIRQIIEAGGEPRLTLYSAVELAG